MMMLFWILAIAGGAYAIAELSRRGNTFGQENRPRALEILQERYARGEISKEEFESKKREIAS